jgi:membrane protein
VLTVVDAVIFTLLFHRLAGIRVPLRDLVAGGVFASIGFTVLKLSASVLLQVVVRNRFLATFGVVIGLLVWMDLVARVTLVAAALSATLAADRGHLPTPDPATLAGVRQADLDAAAEEEAVAQEHVHRETDPGARRAARTLLLAGLVTGAVGGWATRRAFDALGAARRQPRRKS